MRRAITDLLLRDFGYKPTVYPNETEEQRKRREAYDQWFILQCREFVTYALRNLVREMITANNIYPTTMREYEERRIHQDLALAECANLLQELQYAIQSLPVDINRFIRFDEMIQKQIALIKGWRKADNRFRTRLKSQE